jgi:hypothetical protein
VLFRLHLRTLQAHKVLLAVVPLEVVAEVAEVEVGEKSILLHQLKNDIK